MKRVLIIIFVQFVVSISNAIVVQRIYMKNGSVLNGYIERQDTSGNYTIRTENAEICLVNAKYATKEDTLRGAVFFKDISVDKTIYEESQLAESWKKWAEENESYIYDGTKRSLMLNDLCIDSVKKISSVRLLETGSKVKYLELSENVYHVTWEDIESIKGDKRKKTDLSGIDRVYQTKNGHSYEGQFAEETNNSLSLYIDGTIETFDVDDVIKYTFKALNIQQDIFEQTPLIDIVYSKNGNVIRGVIVEQNYSNESNNQNYILIRDESGGINSVKLSDLSEIRREINPKYTPKFDLMLKEGEVQVNRSETKLIKVTEFNDRLHVDSITTNTIVKLSDKQFDVEYRGEDYTDSEAFQLVKIYKEVVKKQTYFYMTYKDLASAESHPIIVEKKPNSVKGVYNTPLLEGLYALYNPRRKEAIIIKVE